MFYGEFEHSIDRKGRLILPAKFREVAKNQFVEKFFITRGLDKCLFMFAEEEWRSQENKFKTMSFTKQQSRIFNRLLFSGAVEICADKQGRVLVPQYLKDFAQIRKDAMVVGVSNRIEIWAKDAWTDFYANSRQSFEEIAEKLMDV
jgi:MraZ protein